MAGTENTKDKGNNTDANSTFKLASINDADIKKYAKQAQPKSYFWFSRKEAEKYHNQLREQLEMSLPATADIDKHLEDRAVIVEFPTGKKDDKGVPETFPVTIGQDLQTYDIAQNKNTQDVFQFTIETKTNDKPKGYDDYELVEHGDTQDYTFLIEDGQPTGEMSFVAENLDELKKQIPDFYEPAVGYINPPQPKPNNDPDDAVFNELDKMIGMDSQKDQTREMIALADLAAAERELGVQGDEPPMLHMVLTGEAGTGKTEYARQYAKILKKLGFTHTDKLVECAKEDVTSGFVGQTAKVMKAKIKEAMGGVLFIDEAYTLFDGDSANGTKGYGKEALDTLLKVMEDERDNLVVLMAGYSKEMETMLVKANSGLLSRVAVLDFKSYDSNELGDILKLMLNQRGKDITDEAFKEAVTKLDNYKKSCPEGIFGNGRTVRSLIEQAKRKTAVRLKNDGSLRSAFGLTGQKREDAIKTVTTITLADIQAIDLKKLSSEKALAQEKESLYGSESMIGFGATRWKHGKY